MTSTATGKTKIGQYMYKYKICTADPSKVSCIDGTNISQLLIIKLTGNEQLTICEMAGGKWKKMPIQAYIPVYNAIVSHYVLPPQQTDPTELKT